MLEGSDMIYLDNGATSFPKPAESMGAMLGCMSQYCGNPGRSGHYMSMKTGEEVYHSRRKIAGLFNIDQAQRLVFTKNTTEALNLGMMGLLKSGDHVVTTSMEHNSVLRPLKTLEKRGVEHTIVKGDERGRVSASKIMEAVRPDTRMIVMTAASNVTGTKMPLKEVGKIAAEKHIIFMVDGAQAAGSSVIDVEAMHIDMLAVPGHKGLLGPLGTGALYVRDGLALSPLLAGGTGTESKSRLQPKDFPEGFEAGTINAPGIIALGCSVAFVEKIGPEVIGKYEEELIACLEEDLRNMSHIHLYGPEPSEKTGICLLNCDGTGAEELTALLSDEFGIAVRGGYHCAGLAHKTIGTWQTGAVRVSVGPYNTKRDMKALAEALWKVRKR